MVDINQKTLLDAIPELMKQSGGNIPAWMNKANDIVTGLNKMLEAYHSILGKPAITSHRIDENNTTLPAFTGLLQNKEKRTEKVSESEVKMPSEFQELLAGLIKSLVTLESIGAGEKLLGEVIAELPFSVTQTRQYLSEMYNRKYQQ